VFERQSQRVRGAVQSLHRKKVERICPIRKHSHSREMGHRLLENLEALCVQFRLKEGRPCDVASWPRKAGNRAGGNGIPDVGYDNGDAGRRPFRCQCWWRTLGDDQIDLDVNKLGRKGRKALVKPVRIPIFVADIPRLHIAALL
jgi:hypothetical protein